MTDDSIIRRVISDHLREHAQVISQLEAEVGNGVATVAKLISDAISSGNTIFWCGNGGSASDSQHLAAEFVGRFRNNRRPLAAIALSTDTSVITCIANDFGYEEIFSRQIEALGHAGDVLVAISTSGNSQNVIRAVNVANKNALKTIGLLGASGGELKNLVNYPILVPSNSTARIQESHILIGHMLCDLTEVLLGLS